MSLSLERSVPPLDRTAHRGEPLTKRILGQLPQGGVRIRGPRQPLRPWLPHFGGDRRERFTFDIALREAMRMAKDQNAMLQLVHVVDVTASYMTTEIASAVALNFPEYQKHCMRRERS